VPNSLDYTLKEDITVDGLTIKEGTNIKYNIKGLHTNPNEWQQPYRFLPERFDPDSKYYKTVSGEMRNEQSYIPFGIGERRCLGYRFAELVMPVIVINITHNYDFTFTN
jgi:cytochrome P450